MRQGKVYSQKDNLVDFIEKNVKDTIIKRTIIDVFNDTFEKEIMNNKYSRDRLVLLIGWYILAYQLFDVDIRSLTWRLVCDLYNTDYYLMLCKVEKFFTAPGEKGGVSIK